MNHTEIMNGLMNFYGTEQYYRMHPKFILTDGTKWLGENAGCFWLYDLVWSYMGKYGDTFACVNLKKRESDWLVTIDDGNGNVFAKQEIEYSDFPLDNIKLYVVWNTKDWVLMLTSEY